MQTTPNYTVLLVEDDDVDAMAVRRMFNKQETPVRIERARDGGEGLTMLRSLIGDEATNLMVLLDINMPRVNGHQFLKTVRGENGLAKTIVFVLTTSVDPSDVTQAYGENVAGYFQKASGSKPDLEICELLNRFAQRTVFPPHELS